jgi:hypothetical protein
MGWLREGEGKRWMKKRGGDGVCVFLFLFSFLSLLGGSGVEREPAEREGG